MFKLNRFFIVCSLLVLQWLVMPSVFALSDAVKIDIATGQLIEALESGSDVGVMKATGKLRALKVEDPRLNFFDGQALFNTKQYHKSQKALESYVNTTGRKAEFYKDAITLLGKLESMAASATKQSEGNTGKQTITALNSSLTIDCPEVIDGLNLTGIDSLTQAIIPGSSKVLVNVNTCFYGEGRQYNVQLYSYVGDTKTACDLIAINPNLAIKKFNIPAEQIALMFQPIISPPLEMAIFGLAVKDIEGEDAVRVLQVFSDSAAGNSGIKINDKIVAINDDPANVKDRFIATNALKNSGETVKLKIVSETVPGMMFSKDVVLKKFKFNLGINIRIASSNNLSTVNMLTPISNNSSTSGEPHSEWVKAGMKMLSYSAGTAIVCNDT